MTDAWATIIASIITSVITALVTLSVVIINNSRRPHHEKTARVFGYVGIGLIAGAAIGVIIGLILLARPHPSASISGPTNGQFVPVYAEVTFEYNNIPRDRHLWLVVRIPGIGAVPWLIYPQVKNLEGLGTGNGIFKTTAAFGGGNDSGRPFNLVVLLVDENANPRFVDYADKCKLDENLCNGMILPDKGVEILDFDTVIRE